MKVFKKKLVQRLSCVCCAVAFAIFSVFSIFGFSQKKESEVITASAEASSSLSSMIYYLFIPADTVFEGNDTQITGTVASAGFVRLYSVDGNVTSDYITFNFSSDPSSLNKFPLFCSSEAPYNITLKYDRYISLPFSSLLFDLFPRAGIYDLDSFNKASIYRDNRYDYRYCYDLTGFKLFAFSSERSLSESDIAVELENAYNNGYTQGYEHGYSTGVQDTRDEAFNDGYNEGVEDGKQEAEDKSKRGLFASFESIVVDAYDSSGGFLHSIEADYGVNALSFETAFLEFEYMIENGQLNPSYYKIYFTTEHGYDYEIPLEMLEIIAYGDKSLFGEENSFVGQGSDYYSQTFRNYPMYFDTSQGSDGYPLVIEYNNNDPHLSRARLNNFSVNIPNLNLLRNLQFVATSGYYSQGYTQGVKDGYSSGLTDGEKVGYDKGYEYGENVGYNKGIGDSGEYSFLSLFTAVVDAPIKSFLGLLNFEVLGMDMQRFFLSILTAALCIAVYRLFSGSAV